MPTTACLATSLVQLRPCQCFWWLLTRNVAIHERIGHQAKHTRSVDDPTSSSLASGIRFSWLLFHHLSQRMFTTQPNATFVHRMNLLKILLIHIACQCQQVSTYEVEVCDINFMYPLVHSLLRLRSHACTRIRNKAPKPMVPLRQHQHNCRLYLPGHPILPLQLPCLLFHLPW